MDKIVGRYLDQYNKDFPLDCETLAYLAENQALCEVIGNIAGDKTILYGCGVNADDATKRDEGYVFMKTEAQPTGEVLRFEGGDVSNGVFVKSVDIGLSSYSNAYTKRTLAVGNPSSSTEHYDWSDFSKISISEPLGVVKMWAGKTVPDGYHLCDGADLDISAYPDLYSSIGTTFNSAKDKDGNTQTTLEGKFRLPDLRGRFIVGYNSSDTDYNTEGLSGGEKGHTLTEAELPSHTHVYSTTNDDENTNIVGYKRTNGNAVTYNRANTSIVDSSGSEVVGTQKASDGDDSRTAAYETSATGGNTTIDNRPPYYVLAYIMKLK